MTKINKEKNEEQHKDMSKLEKLQKKKSKYRWSIITMVTIDILMYFFIIFLSVIVDNQYMSKYRIAIALALIGVETILIIITGIVASLRLKIGNEIEEEKERIARIEIGKLNNNEFMRIQLKKTDNIILNTISKNAIIKAKIDTDNSTIVVLKISIFDQFHKDGESASTCTYFFNKEDIVNYIKKVFVEEDIE